MPVGGNRKGRSPVHDTAAEGRAIWWQERVLPEAVGSRRVLHSPVERDGCANQPNHGDTRERSCQGSGAPRAPPRRHGIGWCPVGVSEIGSNIGDVPQTTLGILFEASVQEA
jgi:hypothetical protein